MDDDLMQALKERISVGEVESQQNNNNGVVDGETHDSNENSEQIVEELNRVRASLVQKEKDLELAARIGEKLFQENTTLKQDAESIAVLRTEVENANLENRVLQGQNSSLQKKIDLFGANLAEADATNQSLNETIVKLEQRLREESEKRQHEQEVRDGRGGSVYSQSSPRSSTGVSEATAQREINQLEQTVLKLREELNGIRERLDTERNKWELDNKRLQRELEVTKLSVEQVSNEKELAERRRWQDQIKLLQGEMEQLRVEKEAVERDRDETLELLEERTMRHRTSSIESGMEISSPVQQYHMQSTNAMGSLADELAGTVLETQLPQPSQVDASVKCDESAASTKSEPSQNQPEIDPYYFHFHMTVMNFKAQLSKNGWSGNRGQTFQPSIMNAINRLDPIVMYQGVVNQSIPPDQWNQYIQSCFDQAIPESCKLETKVGHHPLTTNGQVLHTPVRERRSTSTFSKLLSKIVGLASPSPQPSDPAGKQPHRFQQQPKQAPLREIREGTLFEGSERTGTQSIKSIGNDTALKFSERDGTQSKSLAMDRSSNTQQYSSSHQNSMMEASDTPTIGPTSIALQSQSGDPMSIASQTLSGGPTSIALQSQSGDPMSIALQSQSGDPISNTSQAMPSVDPMSNMSLAPSGNSMTIASQTSHDTSSTTQFDPLAGDLQTDAQLQTTEEYFPVVQTNTSNSIHRDSQVSASTAQDPLSHVLG